MNSLRLVAVGDICLQTQNGKHPFENVMDLLKNKDILFGNLEVVLSNEGREAEKAYVMKSPPNHVRYLKDSQFDVLNLANNHILDLGVKGIQNTINILNRHNLKFIGINIVPSVSNQLIMEKNGIKLGFLGYTIGRFRATNGVYINKISEKKVIEDIKCIKDKCDFVVISLHWGTEDVFYPSPYQINFAHKIIDNGATLILGHHPHVIQGIEMYKKGLIAYSLGNFQFISKSSQESIVLNVNFNRDGIENFHVVPIVVDKNFVPKRIDGCEKEKILSFVKEISEVIFNGKVTNKWWYEEIGQKYLLGNMSSYFIRIKRNGIIPLLECCLWLFTPFCIKCYFGILRKYLKKCI